RAGVRRDAAEWGLESVRAGGCGRVDGVARRRQDRGGASRVVRDRCLNFLRAENAICVNRFTVKLDMMCLGWPEAAAAISIPLAATQLAFSSRVMLASIGMVGAVVMNVLRICTVCALSHEPSNAMFFHDVVAPIVTGSAVAAWLFFCLRPVRAGCASRPGGQVAAALLLSLFAGCSSFAPRNVAAWQAIQSANAAAEVDGLSDHEIEHVVRLCLKDAHLCDGDPRFGRLLFALDRTMMVADLELAQSLWAEVLPDATSMALNDARRAEMVLSNISHLGQRFHEGVSRKLDVIDRYMIAFLASDRAWIRNQARLHRAYARVICMRSGVAEKRGVWMEEISSLLDAADQDGLLEVGGDLRRRFLGYGNIATHGVPEVGGEAWVARDGDPAWWRRHADAADPSWSIVFFASADCLYCGPYWDQLLGAVRGCHPGRSPRITAVVASDAIPEYLRHPGFWSVYSNSCAETSWLASWDVSAVPVAFMIDGSGRFLRVGLSLDEIAAAVEDCAKML
ncbi:MAG: exosortase/archaeosortase family protein, partial [Planctomycetota bacterium]